jgi:hypothetical protein
LGTVKRGLECQFHPVAKVDKNISEKITKQNVRIERFFIFVICFRKPLKRRLRWLRLLLLQPLVKSCGSSSGKMTKVSIHQHFHFYCLAEFLAYLPNLD